MLGLNSSNSKARFVPCVEKSELPWLTGKVLEPDNGVSWALPLTEQLDSKLRLANSVR